MEMLNTLGMIAIAVFFLALSWFFVRVATATSEKKEFLAASLCCAGSTISVFGFMVSGLSPIDQFGCTHEPSWIDALPTIGGVALAIGHCIQAWRTRCFLPAIIGMAIIYVETLPGVQAVLPSLIKNVPMWIGLMMFVQTSQIWKNSTTAMLGGFFSKPLTEKFKE